MSNDLSYPAPLRPVAETDSPVGPVWRVPEPPRRFQHVVWKHVLLFLLTLATTTLVGADHYAAFLSEFSSKPIHFDRHLLVSGLWYSLTILTVLGAHEMGHYLACRYYGISASLPYFIGVPTLIGTLGAFIRIRSAIFSRRMPTTSARF